MYCIVFEEIMYKTFKRYITNEIYSYFLVNNFMKNNFLTN